MGEARWRRAGYACMRGKRALSTWSRMGLGPLWLLSWLYGGIVRGQQASYTSGLRRRKRLPCRVVSIGNLTLGGTGKTPLAMWVARWYQQHGCRVAVLSRGYGVRPSGRFRVVSVGDGPLLDWRAVGDEAYLLAQSLPGIPVLTGQDRYLSGRYACDYFGTQVVVLDDGFQHYALHRDLDVVLLDASNPFGHGALLPRGILREPISALRRADAVILTRADMAGTALPALWQQVSSRAGQRPVSCMTTVAEALCQGNRDTGLEKLQGRRAVAFAGIGNPQAFAATLGQLETEVAGLIVFPDHYPYTAHDWQAMVNMARQRQASCLVTTEKDAVRLAPSWQTSIPLYTLRIGVRFLHESPLWQQQLHAVITAE
jgi:tetraacyldisaccharide 4'-kinase